MPTGTPQGDRIIWDDATERHLLMLILLDSNPTVNWNNIATKFGNKATPGALQQKYGKIRKRDAELFGFAIDKSATPSTGKRRRTTEDYLADLTDDDHNSSPSKKPKSKAKVKKEAMANFDSARADSEATTVKSEHDGFDTVELGDDGEAV